MAGISLMAAMYLQVVEGLSPLHAGLWMLPTNIVMAVGSLVAPQLATRYPRSRVMAAGLLAGALGFGLMTLVGGEGGVPLLITGMVLAAGGISLPLPLVMGVILGSAPPEKAGSAASLSETGGEFGIAVGVATLGTLGTLVYRHSLAGALPDGVPAGAAEAARDSVTAATAVAGQLPGTVGTRLLEVAHEAFATGLDGVAGVGAVAFVGLAVLTLVVLRDDADEAASTDDAEPDAEREPLAA
jgi:DHA2 family multidrug resistance protein-like MFS transporter